MTDDEIVSLPRRDMKELALWLIWEVGADVELTPGLESILTKIKLAGYEDYYEDFR